MTCSCLPIPHTTNVKAQICGVVADGETKKALDNVNIVYEIGRYRKEYSFENKNEFKVGPLKQWHYLVYIGSPGVYPFPDSLTYLNRPALLTISADGYETQKLQTETWPHTYVDATGYEFKYDPSFRNIDVIPATQDVVRVYMKKKDN